MRKIERRIIARLKAGKCGKLSKRDRIEDDYTCYSYVLWKSTIAQLRKDKKAIILGECAGRWKTCLTKKRINAIALEFGLPTIIQRNFQWYWSDGLPYNGALGCLRKFILIPDDILKNGQYEFPLST